MSRRGPFAAVQTLPPLALMSPRAEIAGDTLLRLVRRLRAREFSCRELTEAFVERIELANEKAALGAFITVAAPEALAAAERLDELAVRGQIKGPLHGLPIAVKDVLDTQDMRTTGGTRVLSGWAPQRDATAVRRLREAGAVIIGKTNLHEAGLGVTANNRHYGPVRNPYSAAHIAGGSSGGSAAAVAAALCAGALGTDTGGSLRIPPALCGVVGLKPTAGRVGRGGLMSLSFTCDVIGPITRSVADAALLLQVLAAGVDERDPGERPAPAGHDLSPDPGDWPEDPGALRGLRIGVPGGYFARGNHPEVERIMAQVQGRLAAAGAQLVEVDLAGVEAAQAALLLVVVPEAVHLLGSYLRTAYPARRLAELLPEFEPGVQAVLANELGPDALPVPAHAYLRALHDVRPMVQEVFARALAQADLLLTPTTPSPAVTFAEEAQMTLNGEALSTFETFIRYTGCVSLAGLPAITVPGGQTADGLPVGVQFIGPAWRETELLRAAWAYEALVSR